MIGRLILEHHGLRDYEGLRMKRDGFIIEEIVERANLENAFDSVVHGKQRKRISEGKWLIAHREKFLDKVRDEILSGHLDIGQYHDKDIHDCKSRTIQVFNMKSRIKVNAVMTIVDKHLHRRFIRTTSSSIKNRGMHDLKAYIERDIAKDPTLRYWYKFDIRKFYDTVKQDFVMYAIQRIFKDKRLIEILRQLVCLLPGDTGISIGLRTSQGMGNLLLSVYLDHYLKDRYGIKYFYRYCDDGLIGGANKIILWQIRDLVHERIESIGQKIKPNEKVFPVSSGVDFLGYVIYPTHSRLRKRVKKSFCRKLARVKSRKRRIELIGSFYGMAKHGNCRHLLKTILTKKEMHKFSDFNVPYTPKDGKKRFHGKTTRLAAIVNNEVEIHDYERDVKTPHGDNRYLVSFRDPRTNEFGKFFTNSEEMKSQLDSVAEMEDGFPFQTIIRSETFENGRGFRYFFT